MHRCRENGLTHDAEGFALDPDERASALYQLARYTGNEAEAFAFFASFPDSFDPRKLVADQYWRHVYLARYMRLSPREVEAMPLSRIGRYIATLSEFIKKEAGPSQMAETDFV